MGVLHSPESEYAKELWKWDHTVLETNPIDGSKGKRPATFQEYPKALYKVSRSATGGRIEIQEREYAESDLMEANLRSRGFVTLNEAEGHVAAVELEMATLAANRAYQEKAMSASARAEAAAVDEATSRHMAEIPALPIKKRGRPKKGGVDAE